MDHSKGVEELYLTVPLPHSRCTRLLEILETTEDDDPVLRLRLSVSEVDHWDDLDNHVAALSYTWGPPFSTPECEAEYGPENVMWIDITTPDNVRHSRRIGRNLYDALLNVRSSKREFRYLWIDAVCINQDDLDEKAQQVLLMHEIYSKASVVVTWLGIQETSPPGLKENLAWLLRELAPRLDEYKNSDRASAKADIRFTGDIEDWNSSCDLHSIALELDIPAESVRALYHLFARCRYLSRAWIIQEIVLAQRHSLLFGNELIDFSGLYGVAFFFRDQNVVNTAFGESGCMETSGNGREFGILSFMKYLHSRLLSKDQSIPDSSFSILTDLFGAHDESAQPYALLELWLGFGHQRQATNPRDVIYSLLALVSSVFASPQAIVQPAYNKSVEQVYTEVTQILLQKLPHLSILSLATLSSATKGLPSWVPDYSDCKTNGKDDLHVTYAFLHNIAPEFAASGYGNRKFVSFEGKTLRLLGMRCTRISHCFKPFSERFDGVQSAKQRAVEATKLAESILKICDEVMGPMYPTGDSPMEALCRVVTSILPWQRDSASLCEGIRCAFITILSDAGVAALQESNIFELLRSRAGQWGMPFAEDIEWAMRAARDFRQGALSEEDGAIAERISRESAQLQQLSHCNLFVDDRGYVGRTQSDLHIGDEIWLLCGARVPFVLRSTGHEGEYRLVAEALIHGAMYGEWVENWVAGEIREIRIV